MAIILSLETSTSVCSAAIHDQGKLVVSKELNTPQAAAAQLMVLMNQLIQESGLTKSSIDAVAVSGGPGSYTGLRIGAATAKGVCFALGIPLIALDSLHVIASSAPAVQTESLICPMIDARRMEVYCCLLTSRLDVVEPSKPLVVDEGSFNEALARKPIVFMGSGASKCKVVIRHPNASFLDHIDPRASAMGGMAFRKFEEKDFSDLRTFEPAYLKEFVAKTKKT